MLNDVPEWLDLIGIAAFALSGALLGVRRRFDIVGMAVLATATGLGGGLLRDVIIGAVPPVAMQDPWWIAVPLVATVVTFFFHPHVQRMHLAVDVLDAVGLGVFCATATATAWDYGVSPPAAVLLGLITGIGGGILRDVLAGVRPTVLRRDSQLYAIPALAGSVVVALGLSLGLRGLWLQALAAAGIAAFRMLAMWRDWHGPTPRLTDLPQAPDARPDRP